MPEPTVTDVVSALRADLAQVLGGAPEAVDLDERLTELPGIDSSKLVEVVVACERRWEIELDEDQIFDVRTAQDLADLIEESVKGRLRA